ncbi:PREDICTED: hexokinase type 2 isoform X2 [Nicrophorus vespilloides]|uniref:Phosphotransferase n=1 Tax=Nicrophorus vespilloides TaxID=110193 RepID=A0ABM1N117_NICVS|nr:PREDICTED: hexokinase type 2 isoform X2 [Nicrophorus vespilloides]
MRQKQEIRFCDLQQPLDDEYEISNEIQDRCKELILGDDQLKEVMKRLTDDINKGLGKKTHADAIVKCFVTYVQDLPNGTEKGKFLALDLGGTNFRVLLIELGDNHFEMKSKIFAIPQHIMLGSGEQLFDHIADCLAKFMKEEKVQKEKLPLGFTFSFPLQQLGLTRGMLERWTKGFNCSGVIGQDVVQLLKDAIARRGDIQISVMAILNDSTGTLMSCAWVERKCRIGVITGTGTNACYVEKQKNAELFDGQDNGSGKVLINTEWGAFGDDGQLDFVRTEYDRDIDEHSINPGKQLHEKMISGMYMGELARLVLQKLTKEGLLFNGKGSDPLFTRQRFYTKYVSEIENEPHGTYNNCRQILEELGIKHASEQDCVNVRYVCECVSRRAAHLVSAGIACLLNKMDDPTVTVGIDGSVYRYHPHFHNLMVAKISNLVNKHIKFNLMLSDDGSGRGAALVAAVASRK